MATKTPAYRPRVGDERWFVEWCVEIGMVDNEHPEYGCDPDKNLMGCRMVRTREEAEAFAREIYPKDKIGAVAYWPAEFVAYDEDDALRFPHAGHWEATADPEYYEGEE